MSPLVTHAVGPSLACDELYTPVLTFHSYCVFTLQVSALEKKAGKKAALEQLLKDAFRVCLLAPFTEAAAQGRTRSCTASTQSWLAYISQAQVRLLLIL